MLQVNSTDARLENSPSAPVTMKAPNWREEAVTAYRRGQRDDIDRLGRELVTRVLALTGQTIDARSVYINHATRVATVGMDGMLFVLRGRELYLVRSCVYCGVRRFESSPIHDLVDLGHALSMWEPRCEGCSLEDESSTYSF